MRETLIFLTARTAVQPSAIKMRHFGQIVKQVSNISENRPFASGEEWRKSHNKQHFST
jgi:hypothetical protein